MSLLEIGDKAPDFALPRDGGTTVTSKDMKDKPYILFFYPKDSTPGCTIEAKDFSAFKKGFSKIGVELFGVSADSVKRHDNFVTKQNLTIPLLSDENKILIEAYGVWVQKKLYGREYMGIERATFLINSKGKIAHIWPKVKVKGHAQEVLELTRTIINDA